MDISAFNKWYRLDSVAVRDIPEHGDFVYIFRKCSTKEIIYIGSTADLRRRLFGNYIGGVGGRTTKRIHALLFEEGAKTDTEVAWKKVPNYKLEEKHLLQVYFEKEGHLPIWNKRF